MKKFFLLFIALILGLDLSAQRQELFVTTADSAHPYRIPAIAHLKGKRLLSVTDYRLCGADIGFGRVDLHGRLSQDNGRTWSSEYPIIRGTGVKHAADCGYGDAAIVSAPNGRDILLLCVCGNTVYGAASTTRQNPNRVARLYSHDGGKTWSAPEDITEDIYSLFDESQLGPIQSLFFTSGRICQSRTVKIGKYYRLYAAICARPNGNRVVYSDDFGHTWKPLGSIHISPAPKGDEVKCEELPNGDVALSSRTWGGRYFNIFHYRNARLAEGEWGEVAYSSADNQGVDAQKNSTNGGILIIPARRTSDNRKTWVALQSVPLGPGRSNVGIYYKALPTNKRRAPEWEHYTAKDFATGWGGPLKVTTLGSAYSTMVQQTDGRIAFFYEEETYGKGACYTNMYVPLTLERITDGKFSALRTQLPPKAKRR